MEARRTDRGAWGVFLVIDADGGSRQRIFEAESFAAAAERPAFIPVTGDPAVRVLPPQTVLLNPVNSL